MARPENPIADNGPVADLARALRQMRARAGNLSYRKLATRAHYSASVLAAAASGGECPTWRVTESYARACGADPDVLKSLWAKADYGYRKRRHTGRLPSPTKLAKVSRLPTEPAGGHAGNPPLAGPTFAHGPDPSQASTPEEYRHHLRALRAWAGNPGIKEVWSRTRSSGRLSRTAFYNMLHPRKTTLPDLGYVQLLVAACGGDVREWTSAWQAVSLREFYKANPPPERVPTPAREQDDALHASEQAVQ